VDPLGRRNGTIPAPLSAARLRRAAEATGRSNGTAESKPAFIGAPSSRGTGPEPGSWVRHRHCSDASRRPARGWCRLACRRRRHPVVAGAVSLLPPRALGLRCASPHPRSGGACQALRGRASSIAAVCPRTLALGTCRDRRSRVSPARSLFSSQAANAHFVLTPPELGFPPGAMHVRQSRT
jgi:hypothetical protein